MFFTVRSNDSFNFPLGLINYIVNVIVVIVVIEKCSLHFLHFYGFCDLDIYGHGHQSKMNKQNSIEDNVMQKLKAVLKLSKEKQITRFLFKQKMCWLQTSHRPWLQTNLICIFKTNTKVSTSCISPYQKKLHFQFLSSKIFQHWYSVPV